MILFFFNLNCKPTKEANLDEGDEPKRRRRTLDEMEITKEQILQFIRYGNIYILRDLKELGCEFTDYDYIKTAVAYECIVVVEFLIKAGCVPDENLLNVTTSNVELYKLLYKYIYHKDILMNIEIFKQEIIDMQTKFNKKVNTVLNSLEEFKTQI